MCLPKAITVGGTATSSAQLDDETEGVRSVRAEKLAPKNFTWLFPPSKNSHIKLPLCFVLAIPVHFVCYYCPYAFRVVCVVARQHMFSIHTFMFSMFSLHTFMFSMFSLPISGQSVCVDWPWCYNSSLLPPWTITFLDSNHRQPKVSR